MAPEGESLVGRTSTKVAARRAGSIPLAIELANRLAARGCRVTGLDSSAVFLDRARTGAGATGVSVEYVAGDMRQLPWTGRFDRVANWSTAFGYFDDAANRAVLDGIVRALRPGSRLAMDLDNLTAFLAS